METGSYTWNVIRRKFEKEENRRMSSTVIRNEATRVSPQSKRLTSFRNYWVQTSFINAVLINTKCTTWFREICSLLSRHEKGRKLYPNFDTGKTFAFRSLGVSVSWSLTLPAGSYELIVYICYFTVSWIIVPLVWNRIFFRGATPNKDRLPYLPKIKCGSEDVLLRRTLDPHFRFGCGSFYLHGYRKTDLWYYLFYFNSSKSWEVARFRLLAYEC